MTYRKVEYVQRSIEWLAWRKWRISSSIIPALMGECPYTTPQMLYNRIVNDEKVEMNADMQRGVDNEKIALDKINEANKTSYSPACFESIEHPHLICSLDGWDDNAKIKGIEIKNPRRFSMEIQDCKCPAKYYGQLQHCMLIMDEKEWFYTEMVEGKINLCIVKRDDAYIDKLLVEAKKFYECLMRFEPPPCETDKDWAVFGG